MNREQTLALYEQGVEAWNKWANEMLEERKRLEEAGEWSVEKNSSGELLSCNEKTQNWIDTAEANFSIKNQKDTFSYEINLKHFLFPGNTIFNKIIFNNKVSCFMTKFLGIVQFLDTTFNDETTFAKAIFYSTADFSNSDFNEYCSFNAAKFKNKSDFSFTEFNNEVDFQSTHFEKKTYFNQSEFNDEANFFLTNFKETVEFKNSLFKGYIEFQMANFSEFSDFSEAVFENGVNFSEARFKKDIIYNQSSFLNNINFTNASFNEYADFKKATFLKEANFEKAKFNYEANFNAIISESAFSLEGVKFSNNVPDFIQANFKEAPRLDNIKIGDEVAPGSFKNSITTYIHPDIKARYQALKRLAVQAHDHENEQRFWAGELRSDRSLRTEDGGWNLRPLVSAFWWGNIAYGCFSDYGRSIVRPLGTLLVLVILMTGLHLSVSKEPLSYENTFSAGYISTRKSIFNLGADPTKRSILKEKYSALYGVTENQTPNIPKSILIAEMGQTLLSAIFIFLTLLGVRNNFKMK